MAWTCPACGTSGDESQPPERCAACDAHLAEILGADTAEMPTTDQRTITRRKFFEAVSAAAGLGAVGAACYMGWRFLQPAAPLESPPTVVLEPPSAYPEGRTFVEAARSFIERRGSRLRCISAVCTHLGCLVSWDASGGIYHCPCHSSDFSADGERLRGPASRALPFHRLSVGADGRLVIHRRQEVARGAEWLDVG